MAALVIYVRLHDGRYHGRGDWPPSPARVFQALVAGAGLGGPLREAERTALKWLEKQRDPIIAAPRASQSRRGVLFYMPNNDTDRIEGDPSKTAKIRTATKVFRPRFFDAVIPFVYAWSVGRASEDQQNAEVIRSLTECLYQLGRGVDMAWAWGEMLEDSELDDLLAAHPGQVFRPSKRGDGIALPAPCPDSLVSVEHRYLAYGTRFSYRKEGNGVRVVFRQPPKPRFQPIAYDSPPSRQLFELRDPVAEDAFAPWPLERAYGLVVRLRDAAVERLKRAMPAHSADIDRVLVGRKPDGTNDCQPENRVRIIPLSSVGHIHADHQIRRVLVEVPPSCSLRPDDVQWAFSGLDIVAPDTGEALATLIRTDDGDFLRNYGVEDDNLRSVWRTVTPAALPESAQRRRIDPARRDQEAKAGMERKQEQVHAAAAVCQALRHAGVRLRPEVIRVQREPFEANGRRAETFAEDTRFSKHRLWHVEVEFHEGIHGPLVVGDGRFLGLGIMAPVQGRSAASVNRG
jgi:CRISPR-associated protein Csb2